MVDIGAKRPTHRIATAIGRIAMQRTTRDLIASGEAKKGDVLAVARIAGIMGAKRTSDLVPLCHPLSLTRIAIDFEISPEVHAGEGAEILCTATVETVGPTGVEMEALTAVQVSLLTIYDMCKAVDRHMSMKDIRVVEKKGGKHDFIDPNV